MPGAATESMSEHVAEMNVVQPVFTVEQGTTGMGQAMFTKKPWITNDAGNDGRINSANRRLNQKYGWQGAALIPLLADDRSIGALSVADKRKRDFTDDEVSLLSAFADQASLATGDGQHRDHLMGLQREARKDNAGCLW